MTPFLTLPRVKSLCIMVALAALAACNGSNNSTPNPGTPVAKGTMTEFASGPAPIRITVGPDSALWFTEGGSSKIGRMTTLGVVTNEFPTLTTGAGPFGIATGLDGNL